MRAALLTGRSDQHLTCEVDGTRLQSEAGTAYLQLKEAAREAGFNLCIASGFRSYERQLTIWQRKFEKLSATPLPQRFHEILRWSALPGASRHHWGTDIDIYDPTALKDTALQLVPEEYTKDGPMVSLMLWLYEFAPQFGFFWPYAKDNDGVAPEPWHLSYRPVAQQYFSEMSVAILMDAWKNEPPAGHAELTSCAEELFARYVTNICE